MLPAGRSTPERAERPRLSLYIALGFGIACGGPVGNSFDTGAELRTGRRKLPREYVSRSRQPDSAFRTGVSRASLALQFEHPLRTFSW
jgi:hypothetical protein